MKKYKNVFCPSKRKEKIPIVILSAAKESDRIGEGIATQRTSDVSLHYTNGRLILSF